MITLLLIQPDLTLWLDLHTRGLRVYCCRLPVKHSSIYRLTKGDILHKLRSDGTEPGESQIGVLSFTRKKDSPSFTWIHRWSPTTKISKCSELCHSATCTVCKATSGSSHGGFVRRKVNPSSAWKIHPQPMRVIPQLERTSSRRGHSSIWLCQWRWGAPCLCHRKAPLSQVSDNKNNITYETFGYIVPDHLCKKAIGGAFTLTACEPTFPIYLWNM